MKPVIKNIKIEEFINLPRFMYTDYQHFSGPIRSPLPMKIEDVEALLKDDHMTAPVFETICIEGVWQTPVILSVDNFEKTYSAICAEQGVPFNIEFFTEETTESVSIYEGEKTPVIEDEKSPVIDAAFIPGEEEKTEITPEGEKTPVIEDEKSPVIEAAIITGEEVKTEIAPEGEITPVIEDEKLPIIETKSVPNKAGKGK